MKSTLILSLVAALILGVALAALLAPRPGPAPNDLAAENPELRRRAFAYAATLEWPEAWIRALEQQIQAEGDDDTTAREQSWRLLGPGGPPLDALSDDVRLHLARQLATQGSQDDLLIAAELLDAPLRSPNARAAARLTALLEHAAAHAPSDAPALDTLLRAAHRLLAPAEIAVAAELRAFQPGAAHPSLHRAHDLALAWRLSPAGGPSADLTTGTLPEELDERAGEALLTARRYRRARASGPDRPVDATVRHAARNEQAMPALPTILAAQGGPEAIELLAHLSTRSQSLWLPARAALGRFDPKVEIESAQGLLSQARLDKASAAQALLRLIEHGAITEDELERWRERLLQPVQLSFEHSADVLPIVLFAERTLHPAESAELAEKWMRSFSLSNQAAGALLALLCGAPPAPIAHLLEVSEDPAHRSLLRLILDAMDAPTEEAQHFALRAMGQRTSQGPDILRLSAAALAGSPEALDTLLTLPAHVDLPGLRARMMLTERLLPEVIRDFGRPIATDPHGAGLWFEAAARYFDTAHWTRRYDREKRHWTLELEAS